MSKAKQTRRRAMSLRGGIAIAGAIAVAAGATQGAGTLAAPVVAERTAKLPVASANYFPTPLPSSISCSSNTVGLSYTEAVVSWTTVPGMKYRVRVLREENAQVIADSYQEANSYRFRAGVGLGLNYFRVRVHAVNVASGSTDVARVVSSGYVSNRVYSTSGIDTRCPIGGGVQDPVPNQAWENTQRWSPPIVPFAVTPQVVSRSVPERQTPLIAEERVVDATLEDAALETTAVPATTARSTTAPATSAVPAAPGTSGSTTAPTVKSATSSSTPTPSITTTATSAPTTVLTSAGPVALPGGGEAAIIGGTTLVVSDGEAPVCTATVRPGSVLRVRSGVLEVVDDRETRAVDLGTCGLT